MSDREVRQVLPEPVAENGPVRRMFANYAEYRCIVLLGDPGSGKSHLFAASAEASGGTLVTTRDFLNIPNFPAGADLFINGLDERRAGREDHSTIDAVVQCSANARHVETGK
jgi:hypothetical protein